MTSLLFKRKPRSRVWKERLRICLSLMLKHFAASTWSGQKNVNAPDFIICCRKKRIWLKILSEGWYFKQDHSQHLRIRSGEEGGGRVPYETAHSGPCTLPHFPNRDEKLRPLVASSWRQCSPHPFFWQDFLALEPVSQIQIPWSRLNGLIIKHLLQDQTLRDPIPSHLPP